MAGVLVTLVIFGFVAVVSAVGHGLARWGSPIVYSDDAVRSRLTERGVNLPVSAHHMYHAIAGFVDHAEFIGFSTAPEDAMPSAMDYARRAAISPTFVSGSRSKYDFVNKGPLSWGKQWATPLWDIAAVTTGLTFEAEHTFVLVDTAKSRVYIATWSE